MWPFAAGGRCLLLKRAWSVWVHLGMLTNTHCKYRPKPEGGIKFSSRIRCNSEMQGHAVPRASQYSVDEIGARLGTVRLLCLGPWLSVVLGVGIWMTKDILRCLLPYYSMRAQVGNQKSWVRVVLPDSQGRKEARQISHRPCWPPAASQLGPQGLSGGVHASKLQSVM